LKPFFAVKNPKHLRRSIGCSRAILPLLVLWSIGFNAPPLLANEASSLPHYPYDDLLRYGYDDSSVYGDGISPHAQRLRLEIDLSRRQLILYQDETQVKSYPVAVGRQGWRTPIGSFEVAQMIHDPAWTNPFTGRVIAGGSPENPLGRYWIGFWTDGQNWVGMHGTPNPESVGREASHGCIRLYNRDIQELFTLVQVGTPVDVVP
jgi:lipoprotein-anchoring transpeptidase ErfK/SrfK